MRENTKKVMRENREKSKESVKHVCNSDDSVICKEKS